MPPITAHRQEDHLKSQAAHLRKEIQIEPYHATGGRVCWRQTAHTRARVTLQSIHNRRQDRVEGVNHARGVVIARTALGHAEQCASVADEVDNVAAPELLWEGRKEV